MAESTQTLANGLKIVVPSIEEGGLNLNSNFTLLDAHLGNDGSDHSFIDQNVTSGSSPTLSGENFSNIPNSALDSTFLENLVEDLTPQLGGSLDLNGNDVGSASAADLTKLSELTATSTELNYVDGVTSAIQTQLDGKSATGHTHTEADITDLGAYLENVVEDTTPQLGGNLDTNSQHIIFDDNHGILDDSSNEQLIFQKTASAVNHFDITNAATGNAPSISAVGGDTNIGLILTPKGTGAFQADFAGNARGLYSVDLQRDRSAATQVASGNNSTISGGVRNTASGLRSTVSGGRENTASGGICNTVSGGQGNTASGYFCTVSGGYFNSASSYYSTVSGGYGNEASSYYSSVSGGFGNTASGFAITVSGGQGNTASSYFSTVSGGSDNTASGDYSTVSGGYNNTASGLISTISGGYSNNASGENSTVSGGSQAVANLYGQDAYAAGRFAADGDAQTSVLVARRSTTDATQSELFLNGSSERMVLADQDCWLFKVYIVARRQDANNEGAAWEISGCIDRNGTSTALIGAINKTVIADDSSGTWDVTAEADDTNEALVIKVTGEAAKTIRWVARIELTEVNG